MSENKLNAAREIVRAMHHAAAIRGVPPEILAEALIEHAAAVRRRTATLQAAAVERLAGERSAKLQMVLTRANET